MTDAGPAPQQILSVSDPAATDASAQPAEHHDHAIVNRRLDEDAV